MTRALTGSAQLRALEPELSARDWSILRLLDQHRFLTTGQMARLRFWDHRSPSAGVRACVRSLDRLRQLRLVTRLERAVGGVRAGSRAFVWTLDVAGDRLLDLQQGDHPRQGRRFTEPSTTFLAHTLAVAEARVLLEEGARGGDFELLRIDTEPTCWRTYTDGFGRAVTLKPDLAVITATDRYEDAWYLEIDRGTESVRRLLAKCAQYESYRRSGREQAESGVFPLVVWVVPDGKRQGRLEGEIADSTDLDPALYRVIERGELIGLVTGDPAPADAPATPTPTHLMKGGTP